MEEKSQDAESTNLPDDNSGGKYLTFYLNEEEYGIGILKVHQIIQMQDITRVPGVPNFMSGVINLRGRVIPIMDLRLKFEMEKQPFTDKTCIIVMQVKQDDVQVIMGMIIDEVKEVLEINSVDISPPPSLGEGVNIEFIKGLGKVKDRVIMLLDVDKVLSKSELSSVTNIN